MPLLSQRYKYYSTQTCYFLYLTYFTISLTGFLASVFDYVCTVYKLLNLATYIDSSADLYFIIPIFKDSDKSFEPS